MQDEIFNLPDGGQILLRIHEGSVYVYIDGQPAYGPLETVLARKKLNIPLPDDRGVVFAKLGHDDHFAAAWNGQRLLRPGEKPPRNKRVTGDKSIRSASNMLVILACISYAMVAFSYWVWTILRDNPEIASQLGQEIEIPAWTWYVACAPPTMLVLLALWARWDDRKAGLPMAIGGVLYLLNSLVTLANGNWFGSFVAAVIMTKLFTAAMASSAAKGAEIERQAKQQQQFA